MLTEEERQELFEQAVRRITAKDIRLPPPSAELLLNLAEILGRDYYTEKQEYQILQQAAQRLIWKGEEWREKNRERIKQRQPNWCAKVGKDVVEEYLLLLGITNAIENFAYDHIGLNLVSGEFVKSDGKGKILTGGRQQQ